MAGLYFEEFTVGRVFDHAWTRTVTEMDNVLFSSLTMNVQPLHLDEEFASKTEFGQRIVNSLFTLGPDDRHHGERHDARHHDRQSRHDRRALPQAGVPRRHAAGDAPRCSACARASRGPTPASSSSSHVAINQRGETVAECTRQALMRKKPKDT